MQDVFTYLGSLGYPGSFVLPMSAFDPLLHQRQDGKWFSKEKDYCDNFIFRKVLLAARQI